jgi:hypothetical protein
LGAVPLFLYEIFTNLTEATLYFVRSYRSFKSFMSSKGLLRASETIQLSERLKY